jgi:hypothetical protein
MSRFLKFVLAANLIALAALSFTYPDLMVAPGKLIPGHKQLNTDCFACHGPFGGADSERCINCHKPANIGRLTTLGLAIVKPLTSTQFHQNLISTDCVACHSDHAGVKVYRKNGHFNHALLKLETNEQCQNCHKSPNDSLHQKITGKCSQCHNQNKWLPATFNHVKYFMLDSDHNARCVTCHVRDDYKRYTCYGCHEHTQSSIRSKHIEEGIRDFDNCVKCHRSANEDDIQGGDRGREDGRED